MSLFNNLMKSSHNNHPLMRSLQWVSKLPKLPELFFNRWAFFDSMIRKSKKYRPFYEFGVFRGNSFKYLINNFKKGYVSILLKDYQKIGMMRKKVIIQQVESFLKLMEEYL